MFFNAVGDKYYPGQCVKTFDFQVCADTALPNWLSTTGSAPVLTFSNPSVNRGVVEVATKATTPTSGDVAGLATAFNINFDHFKEVGLFVYSALVKDAASAKDHNFAIDCNDGSGGFYVQSTNVNGATQVRLYPGPVDPDLSWCIANEYNYAKRKNMGVIIRPATKEFFFTTGDPREGAGVIFYDKSRWVTPYSRQLAVKAVTRTAAQRTLQLSRIKLVLVHD